LESVYLLERGTELSILDIAIIFFVVMEMANVCILYFAPDSRKGNGVAIFNHWENSKEDESAHRFAQYMTNWVAGTKLIFIFLLIVVLLTGDEWTKICSIVVMIVSIASYYWRLHPIIKKCDEKGEITPKGYSKALGFMIAFFLVMFTIALVVCLLSSFI